MTISGKRASATYRRAKRPFLPPGIHLNDLIWTGKKVMVPLQGPTWNRVESSKTVEAVVIMINPKAMVAHLEYEILNGKKPVRFRTSIPVRRIDFKKNGKNYFSYVARGGAVSGAVRAYQNITMPQPWGNKG